MTAGPLLRVAVVGATGAVGREMLALLESRRFPLQELRPVATNRSVGETVEILGHSVPVQTDVTSLRGMDLAFLCTPREAALAWVRLGLEAEVPCVDLSGAVADQAEVPLLAADLEPGPADLQAPLLATPGGSALAWSLVLEPLRRAAGLKRVVGTGCESASGAGRAGIDTLQAETLALFNQREVPDSEAFDHEVAFDCLPGSGSGTPDADERELERDLQRLLGAPAAMAVTILRVPTFAGCGANLAIETERPLTPAECTDLLMKAPGVSVWDEGPSGPSTRDAVGEEQVLVGRIRRDPSTGSGLLVWLAADPVCLGAANALRLAEMRLRTG